MTRRLVIMAIAAATLAAPALANDHLARSLGVEPGLYTTAELARMRTAAEENDTLTYRTIERRGLERTGSPFLASRNTPSDWRPGAATSEVPTAGSTHAGKERLAAAMGVDPDDHSMAELAAMFIDAHD